MNKVVWNFSVLKDESIECGLCREKASVILKTDWNTTLYRCFKCFQRIVEQYGSIEFRSLSGKPLHQLPINLKDWKLIAEANETSEEEAEKVKNEAMNRIGIKPIDLKATFISDRGNERFIYYNNIIDVPSTFSCSFEGPRTTFMLKKIEACARLETAGDKSMGL